MYHKLTWPGHCPVFPLHIKTKHTQYISISSISLNAGVAHSRAASHASCGARVRRASETPRPPYARESLDVAVAFQRSGRVGEAKRHRTAMNRRSVSFFTKSLRPSIKGLFEGFGKYMVVGKMAYFHHPKPPNVGHIRVHGASGNCWASCASLVRKPRKLNGIKGFNGYTGIPRMSL